jgi:ribose 5-phosphate isomerase A
MRPPSAAPSSALDLDVFKQRAAAHAVTYVANGMVLGLGHGSTAIHAIRRIGQLISTTQLRDIRAIATSHQVERDARALGIPLVTLQECPEVDLTIDGADEIDPELNVIKGGGGALLREKIVAQASARLIIVADHTKLSPRLGTQFPIPLEVIPFAAQPVLNALAKRGGRPELRTTKAGRLFETDQNNWIIDWHTGPIDDLEKLVAALDRTAGILDHGLFLGLAGRVVTAGPAGVQELTRDQP